MPTRYFTPAVLSALLILFQGQLWFGDGGLPSEMRMAEKVRELRAENAKLALANERSVIELTDLVEGMELVEAYAREELGMVKPNEVFVQVVPQ